MIFSPPTLWYATDTAIKNNRNPKQFRIIRSEGKSLSSKHALTKEEINMTKKTGKLGTVLLCAAFIMTQLPVTILADNSPPQKNYEYTTPSTAQLQSITDIESLSDDPEASVIVEENALEPYAEIVTANAPQGSVLTVDFDDNGNGGSATDNNNMKTAIEFALQSVRKESVTTLKITGKATAITGYNWRYLIEQYHASKGWSSLTSLDLSNMALLKTIGDNASDPMGNLTRLETLYLPDSLTRIGDYAFYDCMKLTLDHLPSQVTEIGIAAFYSCYVLPLQHLPDNLISIGKWAFIHCRALALQKLPDNLTQIANGTFQDCTNLTQLTLPAKLRSIEELAFDACEKLSCIIMEPAVAPTLALDAFDSPNPDLTFYIPEGSSGYTQDNWNSVKKCIPTAKISLNTDHLTLYHNTGQNTATLDAMLTPDNSTSRYIKWSSSDSTTATVDNFGKVTAKTAGTATITAEIPADTIPATSILWQSVKTATCTVTVRTAHTHSFGSTWIHNDSQHWKECSCGARSQIADHSYGSWSITNETDRDTPGTCKRTCDVCGYEQTETAAHRTLTDPATGITVSGHFTSDAALSVKEAVLHEDGTCHSCDEIKSGRADGKLILLYDIGLSSGIHNGPVNVSIPVGEKYNDQPLILLHCMDKTEERLVTEVKDGCVGGTFTSLSPFAVLETQKVGSIRLTPASLTLELGKNRQLDAAVAPSDSHNKNVTWKTSNKNVAAVSASGEVTAVKAGTATITCTAADGSGAKATCKVTVRNTATPLLILKGAAGKNSIRLNWNQISNADGYEIYGSRCGGTYSYKKIKTITKGTTTTWTQSKLKAATAYKYYIKAYKLVNGRKLYLRTSKTSHVVTAGGRYTNAKSVTTTFTDITLAKGKTQQISARVIPVKKGGKLAAHVPEFRYKTTNSKVAAVTASGKIKAVGKGKCSVYVYANNGVTKRIQITVN